MTASATINCESAWTVQVEVPCKIFGDIHGQLRDLILLCRSSEAEVEGFAAKVFLILFYQMDAATLCPTPRFHSFGMPEPRPQHG